MECYTTIRSRKVAQQVKKNDSLGNSNATDILTENTNDKNYKL